MYCSNPAVRGHTDSRQFPKDTLPLYFSFRALWGRDIGALQGPMPNSLAVNQRVDLCYVPSFDIAIANSPYLAAISSDIPAFL